MKILHCCLSNFYIDGFGYQENHLVKQHVELGHKVKVLASTETYSGSKLCYLSPGIYKGDDGAEVTRIGYVNWLPHFVAKKLRVHKGVLKFLNGFSPDVVMFHGLCGWELRTVVSYAANNPGVKLIVDSHEDFNNSARHTLSRILHRYFYRPVIKSVENHLPAVHCISLETMDFVHEMYQISREKLIFYPLGTTILDDVSLVEKRKEARERLGLSDEDILILQTGKMNSRKKLPEALRAFSKVTSSRLKYIIAGSIEPDIKAQTDELVADDSRIQYVGWQSQEELDTLLSVCDVYVQPGTQSATMQRSLGFGCIVVLDKVPSHVPFLKDNGWLLDDIEQLESVFSDISKLNSEQLEIMKENSREIAKQLLDYRNLAKVILSDDTQKK